jgi:hypothetical protein
MSSNDVKKSDDKPSEEAKPITGRVIEMDDDS